VRVPLGVIGIIYESRPGVTADAAALCLMAGNACLLRGGSEAARSNTVLLDCMAHGLREAGLPAAAVQMVPAGDRALVGEMLGAHGLIDVIIPRGGKGLVARVQAEARVPVLAHLDGINHVYVDASADPEKAVAIVINSKLRRTAVCGSMETLLIDAAAPAALKQQLVTALLAGPCEVRGDAAVQALDARVKPAAPEDWDTEYLDAIASVAEVTGVDGAIAHIAAHGSQHTDSIVAEDAAVAEKVARQYLTKYYASVIRHYDFDGSHWGETKGYQAYQAAASAINEIGMDAACEGFVQSQAWGTPDQIVEKWTRRAELTGEIRPAMAVSYAGMPFDLVQSSLRLIGEKVVPRLHQLGAQQKIAA
jgi:glutamate-5-semialdehyde dehydrogenase